MFIVFTSNILSFIYSFFSVIRARGRLCPSVGLENPGKHAALLQLRMLYTIILVYLLTRKTRNNRGVIYAAHG